MRRWRQAGSHRALMPGAADRIPLSVECCRRRLACRRRHSAAGVHACCIKPLKLRCEGRLAPHTPAAWRAAPGPHQRTAPPVGRSEEGRCSRSCLRSAHALRCHTSRTRVLQKSRVACLQGSRTRRPCARLKTSAAAVRAACLQLSPAPALTAAEPIIPPSPAPLQQAGPNCRGSNAPGIGCACACVRCGRAAGQGKHGCVLLLLWPTAGRRRQGGREREREST